MPVITRPEYQGAERKLVLAFDVGTTYSGVSFCVLDPGISPEIKSVQKYPGQGEAKGDSKIPSVIVYGPSGDVLAIGAEAEEEAFKDRIETEGLTEVRWFKLHFQPRHLRSTQPIEMSPLPPGKSITTVFADILRYLFKCARKYIVETSVHNGAQIWRSKKDIILTHPNGWEGAQQAAMRQAAILAGLIPDTQEGRDSIQFATEGEASLHYCVSYGIVPKSLRNGDRVLIVDAGGGTIDITGYKKKAATAGPFLFEEAGAAQCFFNGSIFVTKRAKAHLQDSLRGSKYYNVVDYIAECFDKTTKITFRDSDGLHFIRFGSLYDEDPRFNIQSGKVKLDGTRVAGFFQPSIDVIVAAIQEAKNKHQIKHAFLVGGFAASDWLIKCLQNKFQGANFVVCPEQFPGKAVASGAISFYLDRFVDMRVSNFNWGTECSVPFTPWISEHMRRSSTKYQSLDGSTRLPGTFSIILPHGTQVAETQEFRESFYIQQSSKANFSMDIKVICYKGANSNPEWIDMSSPEWEVDLIEVDAIAFHKIAKEKQNLQNGTTYFQVNFDVILLFGSTERLKAQISWIENGQEKR